MNAGGNNIKKNNILKTLLIIAGLFIYPAFAFAGTITLDKSSASDVCEISITDSYGFASSTDVGDYSTIIIFNAGGTYITTNPADGWSGSFGNGGALPLSLCSTFIFSGYTPANSLPAGNYIILERFPDNENDDCRSDPTLEHCRASIEYQGEANFTITSTPVIGTPILTMASGTTKTVLDIGLQLFLDLAPWIMLILGIRVGFYIITETIYLIKINKK